MARDIDEKSLGELRDLQRQFENDGLFQRRLAELYEVRESAERATRLGERRDPETRAVVVGISQYDWLPQRWQLKHADKDARYFAAHLLSERGGGLRPENVAVLINDQATTPAIRSAFKTALFRKAYPGDTVYIFIAGHGIATKRGLGEGYLLGFDSRPEEPRTLYPMAELRRILSEALSSGVKILLFADVCHAGMIAGSNAINSKLGLSSENLKGILASKATEAARELDPKALDGHDHGHGVFTYFLVEGLQGKAPATAGTVTFEQILGYVQGQVRLKLLEEKVPLQHPTAIGYLDARIALAFPGKPGIQGPHVSDRAALEQGPLAPGQAKKLVQEIMQRRIRTPASIWQEERDRLAARFEEEGQQVLLRYVGGDELPQGKSDFELGAELFAAAVELKRDTPEFPGLKARELFCAGRAAIFEGKVRASRYAEAQQLLTQAIDLDPDAGYLYNALGIAYLESGDAPRAIEAFGEAIRLNAFWAYPRHNLALAHTERGEYGKARSQYEQAIENTGLLGLEYGSLHYNLGLLRHRLNEKRSAAVHYRQAAKLFENEAGRYERLAQMRENEGYRARACWAYSRAEDFKRNQAEAHNALGALHESQKKPPQAEIEYLQALKLNPELRLASHNLAHLYEPRGADGLKQAIELWQDNLDFPLSRFSLAEVYLRQGRLAESAVHYRAVLEAHPEYNAARVGLARALQGLCDFKTAIQELGEAIRRQPEDPSLYEQLGDLYHSRGLKAQASEQYQEALRLSKERSARRRILRKQSQPPVGGSCPPASGPVQK